MDIEIIYRRTLQTIELKYSEDTRRIWQTAAARGRDYLKRADVAEATEAVAAGLLSEWKVAQAALDHLAFTFVPPIRLTSMEAHFAFNLIAASNLYLIRKGKPWKHLKQVIRVMAEITPVALDKIELPSAEALRCLDMTHWEKYENLREDLAAGDVWLSMFEALKWLLEICEYRGHDQKVDAFLIRLHEVSAPLQYIMDKLAE